MWFVMVMCLAMTGFWIFGVSEELKRPQPDAALAVAGTACAMLMFIATLVVAQVLIRGAL